MNTKIEKSGITELISKKDCIASVTFLRKSVNVQKWNIFECNLKKYIVNEMHIY